MILVPCSGDLEQIAMPAQFVLEARSTTAA
jgi:hypothetical protein